jgi:hypothetical protein
MRTAAADGWTAACAIGPRSSLIAATRMCNRAVQTAFGDRLKRRP